MEEWVGKMRDSTYPTLISIATAYQYKTSSFIRAQTMWQFELSCHTSSISLLLPAILSALHNIQPSQKSEEKSEEIGFQLQLCPSSSHTIIRLLLHSVATLWAHVATL